MFFLSISIHLFISQTLIDHLLSVQNFLWALSGFHGESKQTQSQLLWSLKCFEEAKKQSNTLIYGYKITAEVSMIRRGMWSTEGRAAHLILGTRDGPEDIDSIS